MDINYHYFAVKTLAIKAGFDEDDAQLLASYSQFVDNFDLDKYIYLDSVPEYARHLAIKAQGGWFFNPVTTGYNSNLDFAKLNDEKYQRKVVIPFHYIPQHPLNEQVTDRSAWRTIPAKLDTPSLMIKLLNDAKTQYINNPDRYNLMRIGILLHVFADTYAHQGFSGFNGWENHSMLTKVIDNINDADITSSYDADKYFHYPSIGHANLNHAPNDSNVRFEMRQKLDETDNYSVYYNRSNTRDFVDISKEIFNFLLACLEKKAIDKQDWENFYPQLVKGFKTTEKNTNALCLHWHSIFPSNNYHYEKENLFNKSLQISQNNNPSPTEDFFHYNVIAKEIVDTVNSIIV